MTAARRIGRQSPPASEAFIDERLRDLYAAIRDELNTNFYRAPVPPPPHDLDAQQRVLGAALRGDGPTGALDALRPEDFFGSLDSALFEFISGARGSERCADIVAFVAASLGFAADVPLRLQQLQAEQPVAGARSLLEDIALIRRLARRRAALEACIRLEAALRCGDDEDLDRAADRLRDALGALHG